jgi:4'-phosphopantetheinyl transferase EntD
MTSPLRLDRVEAALAAMFPPGVAVSVVDLAAADPSPLWPPEPAAIIGAVPHRCAEFAAGRQAARRALAALGHPPVALPMGPDRAPIWPEGLSGSIAHAGGIAVAALRRGPPLGVDVEADAPLPPDLWPVILQEDERDRLPPGDTGSWVRQVFAAKEAIFKAQAPANRAMFGFDAVAVTLVKDGFDATFRISAGDYARSEKVHGRLALTHGLVLAGVAR